MIRSGSSHESVADISVSADEIQQAAADVIQQTAFDLARQIGPLNAREQFTSNYDGMFDASDLAHTRALDDGIVDAITAKGPRLLPKAEEKLLQLWEPGSPRSLEQACINLLAVYHKAPDEDLTVRNLMLRRFTMLASESGMDSQQLAQMKLIPLATLAEQTLQRGGMAANGRMAQLGQLARENFGVEMVVSYAKPKPAPVVAAAPVLEKEQSVPATNLNDRRSKLLSKKARNIALVTGATAIGTGTIIQPAAAEIPQVTFIAPEVVQENVVKSGVFTVPRSLLEKSPQATALVTHAFKPAESQTAPTEVPGTSSLIQETPALQIATPALTVPSDMIGGTLTATVEVNSETTAPSLHAEDIDRLADLGGAYLQSATIEYVQNELALAPTTAEGYIMVSAVDKKIAEIEATATIDSPEVRKALAFVHLAGTYPSLGEVVKSDAVIAKLYDDIQAGIKGVYYSDVAASSPDFLAALSANQPVDVTQFTAEELQDMADALAFAAAASTHLPNPESTLLPGSSPDGLVSINPTETTTENKPQKDKQKAPGNSHHHENNSPGHKHPESSKHLTEEQMTMRALDAMEKLGPEWANRAVVLRSFIERGYTATQGAGAIGNFCIEAAGCELNPTITQIGGGTGHGIVQWGSTTWDYDRYGFDNLYDLKGEFHPDGTQHEGTLRWFANNTGGQWDTLMTQVGFIHWELNHLEIASGNELRNSNSISEATDAILGYERPADPLASRDLRIQHAQDTYDKYLELLHAQKEKNKPEPKPDHKPEKTTQHTTPHIPPGHDTVPDDVDARTGYYVQSWGLDPGDITRITSSASGYAHFIIDSAAAANKLGINNIYPGYLDAPALDASVDPYGMYNRECVSYVAWVVGHDKFKSGMPHWGGGDNRPDLPDVQSGNANDWDENAAGAHIKIDKKPAVGSVLQWNSNGAEHSFAGHVAYVEAVNKDGSVVISQYNAGGTGLFSVEVVSPQLLEAQKDQINFIHFESWNS